MNKIATENDALVYFSISASYFFLIFHKCRGRKQCRACVISKMGPDKYGHRLDMPSRMKCRAKEEILAKDIINRP